MPCREQLRLPRPAHERVAPVEEDRVEHRRVGYARRGPQDSLGVARPRARHDPRGSARQSRGRRRCSSSRPRRSIPLAWLIGESTEHAAEHTGAGIGGFLNASFGNAPELIIALFAVADGLPQVVRGSLAGSRGLEPAARVRPHGRRRAGEDDRPPLAVRAARARRAGGDRARSASSCSATPAAARSGTRVVVVSIPISVGAARRLPHRHLPQPPPSSPPAGEVAARASARRRLVAARPRSSCSGSRRCSPRS